MTYTEEQYNEALTNAASQLQSALTTAATEKAAAVAAIQSQLDAANAKAAQDVADLNHALDVNLATIAELTTARDAAIAVNAALAQKAEESFQQLVSDVSAGQAAFAKIDEGVAELKSVARALATPITERKAAQEKAIAAQQLEALDKQRAELAAKL